MNKNKFKLDLIGFWTLSIALYWKEKGSETQLFWPTVKFFGGTHSTQSTRYTYSQSLHNLGQLTTPIYVRRIRLSQPET